jgi:nicotinate-nucleotide adenylyltransferase
MRALVGGTFDPIHCGHLDVARAARLALGLDQVWLVPSRLPPHRTAPRASAAHRFAMAALAIADDPYLLVSDLEMETAGPSYTIDTLDRLERDGHPSRSICFVTGADAFRDIASWKAHRALLDRCHFVVVSRPGSSVIDLPDALPDLADRMVTGTPRFDGDRSVIVLVDAPTAAVSSTDVRHAIAGGRSLEGLVPKAVAAYIARHELYVTREGQPVKGSA